ncbi:hypothetical protein Tco_0826461 [Tanacetum coccineum]
MKHPTSSTNLHSTYTRHTRPQQFDCCEVCRGPHYSSDCQTRNKLIYEPSPSNNYDFPCFDQPPQYHIDQSPPQDLLFDSLMRSYRENNHILEEILRTLDANSPVDVKEPEGPTMEPLDTFLMGDEVISTIFERGNDEFIKYSVDDLVPIPREFELTFDSIDLECSMPTDPPLP